MTIISVVWVVVALMLIQVVMTIFVFFTAAIWIGLWLGKLTENEMDEKPTLIENKHILPIKISLLTAVLALAVSILSGQLVNWFIPFILITAAHTGLVMFVVGHLLFIKWLQQKQPQHN